MRCWILFVVGVLSLFCGCACDTSYIVYNCRTRSVLGSYRPDHTVLVDDAIAVSMETNVFLTAREVKGFNVKGSREIPVSRTRLRLRNEYCKVIEEVWLDFPITLESTVFSPNRKKFITSKSVCLSHPEKAINKSRYDGICCIDCMHDKKGVNQRRRLFCVQFPSTGISDVKSIADFPHCDFSQSFTWIDDIRFIISIASNNVDISTSKMRNLFPGYYLADTQANSIVRLQLQDAGIPIGQFEPIVRDIVLEHSHIKELTPVFGSPIVDSAGSRMAISDIRNGLLVYKLPEMKLLARNTAVRYPFCAFDTDGCIICWSGCEWCILSQSGMVINKGCISGMTLLAYMGNGLFYAEKSKKSLMGETDPDRAPFSREPRKYVVELNGVVVDRFDYGRWFVGRLGANCAVFRVQ